MEHIGNGLPGASLLKEFANQVITQAVTQSYSRDKEDEADKKGTELLAKAGYRADGLRNFLDTLDKVKTDSPDDNRRLGLWGGTHPPLNKRVETLTKVSANYSGGQTLDERYDDNASFGKTKKQLAAEAAAKAKKEQEEKDAAAKAAAKGKGTASGKAKSKGGPKKP